MNMPWPPRPPRELLVHSRVGVWLSQRIESYARVARHPLFWVGAREMAGVSVGLTAWAFMTGVAMVKSGMTLPEAMLMSLLVYAGSAQLAAIPLLAAGAPMWVTLVTGFCVNLRFVVFSLHLRPYLMYLPRRQRLKLGYFTGDLGYVLFTRRYPKVAESERQRRAQFSYIWGGNCVNWTFWQSASTAGILMGNALPERLGMAFAGTLALLAVTVSLVNHQLRVLSVVISGAASALAYGLPYRLNIVVAIVMAVVLCLFAEGRWHSRKRVQILDAGDSPQPKPQPDQEQQEGRHDDV